MSQKGHCAVSETSHTPVSRKGKKTCSLPLSPSFFLHLFLSQKMSVLYFSLAQLLLHSVQISHTHIHTHRHRAPQLQGSALNTACWQNSGLQVFEEATDIFQTNNMHIHTHRRRKRKPVYNTHTHTHTTHVHTRQPVILDIIKHFSNHNNFPFP